MYLDINSIEIAIINLFISVIIIIFYYYYHYIKTFFFLSFILFYLFNFLSYLFPNVYFWTYHSVILLRYYYQEILTLINLKRSIYVEVLK